uniref:ATP-binding protein n=2 Tax=Candidatus Electrothrix sp. TaxID=2170559 RepID=UPI00405794E0
MMKKLPIGISTLSEIINGDYVYIDKTQEALALIANYKYAFLSRPRRFGKSLFLDTLAEIFSGNKELFKGLYIHDKYQFNEYPIIRISFSGNLRSPEGLHTMLMATLRENKKRLGVECHDATDFAVCFKELIENVHDVYQLGVVILIDEYDKAILDNLDQIDVALENREIIKSFYSVMKDCDRYIRFVFLTGVSKFSKTSIFSGLNNLTDISIKPMFAQICGYSETDLRLNFSELLHNVDGDKIKEWYNGYNFMGEKVFNPYDILLFIDNDCQFKSYWFETGTPSFLVKLIRENHYYLPNLEHLEVDSSLINSFDIEDISLESILFQSGYLTIADVQHRRDRYLYTLTYPNKEVRLSFTDNLLNHFVDKTQKNSILDDLYAIFHEAHLEGLEVNLKQLFASIAYNNFTNNEIDRYEGFYASVVYAYFASLGFQVIAEDVTNRSRMDLTLLTADTAYIFEFKIRDEDPLQQIKTMRYYEKYAMYQTWIIGIVFDVKTRNITQFVYEQVEAGGQRVPNKPQS